MSDEVQPPHLGGQEPAVPGEQEPSEAGPAPAPAGGWSPPDAKQQPGVAEPATPGTSVPGAIPPPSPGQYTPAGGPQPPVPNQPFYPPPGNQPPWGTPPPPVGSRGKRRGAILGGGVAALVVAGIVIAVIALKGNGKPSSAPAAGPSSLTATAPNAATPTTAASTAAAAPVECATAPSLNGEPVGYRPCGAPARIVGVPAYDPVQAHRTYTATLKTDRGKIVFTAHGTVAPYTVYNFVYLARKLYFDDTVCHRLTTSGIYVLQCGDPTGSGSGGPGYAFQDENLSAFGQAPSGNTVVYPAGTVAMANAGYATNGSQFFLVYQDSPLPPLYTPFGTITQGLDILKSIAAQGTNNVNGTGDGVPNESVHIEQVTVT